MKKYYFISMLVIVVSIAAGCVLLQPPFKYDVLISMPETKPALNMRLFYSDVTMKNIKALSLSGNMIKTLKTPYTSYTEGFVQLKDYKRLLAAVNSLRKTEGKTALTYFHDYYEDASYFIVSFVGSLDNVYIIDKNSLKAHHLKYRMADNLGDMYVSHIKRINNEFVLIGGEVNAYNAFIYHIDADTFDVKRAVKLATHPSAVHGEHYAVDSSGNSLFINGNKLQVLAASSDKSFNLLLPFEAHNIFSQNKQTIVLSFTAFDINYVLLNDKLQIVKQGKLPLPDKNVTLISAFLEKDCLSLISYDSAHKLYKNYISSYDLSSNKLISCIGIRQYGSFALLGGSLNIPFDSLND